MDAIQIFLILIILIIITVNITKNFKSKIKENRYKKLKKKYHNPKNNYFRNNPEHIDMTDNYINNIWEEINKK